ncbi:histone deacetylase [Pseudoalteromonas sp. C2R02]|uniref:histone deacetylase family protein n=1 Tax=Pseudoalteromonas sp. C2R02 TaxID=2841565 RepID=UPI0020911628|nr:histone deacetylase [Pseudoalteromonas sp. C2R02]
MAFFAPIKFKMSLALVTHPEYSYDFPEKHRFPMQKFKLLHQYLKEQGIATATNTFRPGSAKIELLQNAHCPDYLNRFVTNQLTDKEIRRMGLPWSKGLLRRTLISPVGTTLACQLALKNGIACHLAGGTHHAHYDFASGFCILNDLAIAANALITQGKIKKVLIFDVDVHQGDGTARILEYNDKVFTCSVHCEKNFPARKAQSDLDINIPRDTQTDEYLQIMADGFEKAVVISKPDFIIYDAGVDVFIDDPLGLLNVSLAGIRARDNYVLKRCLELNIPVATVIGGGYDKNEHLLAQRHAIAVEEAYKLSNTFL